MKYWIVIDSWNLMETFTTESLSPHIFYLERAFGNDLTRYISKNGELFNNLVLYAEEPSSDYAIELDDSLLDKSYLCENKKKKYSFYSKTIYFQKGKVRFRFKDQDLIKAFIAESKIIFEVKTVERYSSDFFVESKASKNKPSMSGNDTLSFDKDKHILADNIFNSVKGGVVSYICGIKTTTTIENQSLMLSVNSLKNMIAGLNTMVMMGEETSIDYSLYKISLVKVKSEFGRSPFKDKMNLFAVLNHILDEIISLSTLRLQKVSEQKSPSYKYEIVRLEEKKAEYEELLYKLEYANIGEIKEELSRIKSKEVEIGEPEGKKRKYFPKGSKEYVRKQELKLLIEKYKEENEEYKSVLREYKLIKSSLAYTAVGVTQYDSAISALFTRFSDNINDILKLIKSGLPQNSATIELLPKILIRKDDIDIEIENVTLEEKLLYNIVLRLIIDASNEKQNVVSDSRIVKLVELAGRQFSETDVSNTEAGICIMNTLRTFWMYKKQKTDSFDIPNNFPLLQAIMSFFIKARGFDQIDRFMLNRGYQLKPYAYMLWGAIVGYAAIPKTLTAVINDNVKDDVLDQYLFSMYKSIEKSVQ